MAASGSKRKNNSDKVTVSGYILNLSPIKRSKSQKDYFNLDIETETEVRTAVCFSPSKRPLFNEAALNHSGCEIQNAVNNVDKTLFVSDYSTVKSTQLGFPRTNQYKYLNLHEIINEVPVDTKVNVRGVVVLNDTRYVEVGQNEIPIREGYLIDETGKMKITLWREYTIIQNKTTYDFLQLAKTKYGTSLVLQSIHNTTYSRSDEPVEDYDAVALPEPIIIRGTTIVGIESADGAYCPLCKAAAMNLPPDTLLIQCEKCKNQVLVQNLVRKNVRKVMVQAPNPIKLSLSEAVITNAFPHRNVAEMDETQLSLLLLTSTFNISYDESVSNIVTLTLV